MMPPWDPYMLSSFYNGSGSKWKHSKSLRGQVIIPPSSIFSQAVWKTTLDFFKTCEPSTHCSSHGKCRYYELGPDDPPYAAKFYDCCGAEDPDAPGCTTDYHASYDD